MRANGAVGPINHGFHHDGEKGDQMSADRTLGGRDTVIIPKCILFPATYVRLTVS